jgi:predicted KAP-like P-loop ATPase
MPFNVLSDAPAIHDLLDFDRYLVPLKSALSSATLDTPFTVGIFGAWGTGKSTLLRLLEAELKAYTSDDVRFVCVRFNPWMYRKEPNILIPLLNSLRDALNESPFEQARESGKKMFDVLVRLGADLGRTGISASDRTRWGSAIVIS